MSARPSPPWRSWSRARRRGALVAAAVGIVVAGSVAVDVGGSATTADRAGDLRAFTVLINTDVASCNSSLRDSFSAYSAVVGGQANERSTAIGIIQGDEPNCTPVSNSDLYDLATTEAPGSLRTFRVQQVATDVVSWTFPNAAAAIQDLGTMLAHPGDTHTRDDLRSRVKALTHLDGSAQRSLDSAAVALHTRVERLDLGSTGSLLAAGL
jgi:hypothetical protein